MNQTKKKLSDSGKAGADKRWGKDRDLTRNEVLVDLSKYVDKEFHNFLMNKRKWSNEHLIKLLNYYKNGHR